MVSAMLRHHWVSIFLTMIVVIMATLTRVEGVQSPHDYFLFSDDRILPVDFWYTFAFHASLLIAAVVINETVNTRFTFCYFLFALFYGADFILRNSRHFFLLGYRMTVPHLFMGICAVVLMWELFSKKNNSLI